MHLPEKIEAVVDYLGKIPGVGPKSALRYALILSRWQDEQMDSFSHAIAQLKELELCSECGIFSDHMTCHICSDTNRYEAKTLCVVENVTDCWAIEKGKSYNGIYHILGGVLNPLLGIGPRELKLDKLVDRCRKHSIENIILAINPSVEGDATCSFIRQELPSSMNVERIGFGMPMGGSLEFLDSLTIAKALENRKRMD